MVRNNLGSRIETISITRAESTLPAFNIGEFFNRYWHPELQNVQKPQLKVYPDSLLASLGNTVLRLFMRHTAHA
jgi:hypothetical protein